jgi:hypothetical protein
MATLYEQYIACAKKFTQIKHKLNKTNNTKLYDEFVETLNIFETLNDKYNKNDRDVEEDSDDHSVKSDKDDDGAERIKEISDLCDREIDAVETVATAAYYKNKYSVTKYELDELKKRYYAQYDNADNLDESLRNELAELKKKNDTMAEALDISFDACHALETKLNKIEAVITAR